jgi:NADPH:quinone reductase-like Zn-dependent oxidoreductase
VSRALAPGGELVTIPVFARSLLYETKTVRGFWPFRWLTKTPKDRIAATIDRTLQLANDGVLRVPEGQPIPVEKFGEAANLAEAAERGGKPLLVF